MSAPYTLLFKGILCQTIALVEVYVWARSREVMPFFVLLSWQRILNTL